jgi:gamma-F420-2:alpha-L-glutamate ligase
MVQEYISDGLQSADLRVWVIGGRAIAVMKRVAPEGEFRTNISTGGHGEPFTLTEEIKSISEKTANLFGLDIAGIDLLYDGKNYKVCEANSSPGFEGIDQYCNTNMAKEIVDYVKTRI